MSTISSSTTSTTAYKVTADTTGTLVFQTGATPTTAMTLSSAQVVTFANPPTATGGGSVSTNTAYGTSALAANTSGASGVAIGNSALLNNTTASNNTAVGYLAMSNNTTGTSNTGFGYAVAGSGSATTGAINNITAIGYAALSKTTGDNNTAVGRLASYNNSSGTSNVSVGDSALFNNTTASNNTAIGYQAGYTNSTSADNTFIGNIAGYSTTGNSNSFLGKGAGNAVTSGSGNTIVGRYSGNAGGLDIRTASNYIVLSDGDGNPRLQVSSTGAFTFDHSGSSGNNLVIGDITTISNNITTYYRTSGTCNLTTSSANGVMQVRSGTTGGVYVANGATSWTAVSDERKKDIIEPIADAVNKVSTLRAVIGKYKTDKEGTRRSFLIAQDVKAVLPEAVSVVPKEENDEEDYFGVAYTDVIPLLVAAIKELKAELDTAKAQIAALQGAA